MQRFQSHRQLTAEQLENRRLLAADILCNHDMPTDVNGDSRVSALDALSIRSIEAIGSFLMVKPSASLVWLAEMIFLSGYNVFSFNA